MVPASDAPLEDKNLPCEDPVSLLLQVQVVGVLQEYFGATQLIVSFAKHSRANLGGSLATVPLVRWRAAVDEVAIALGELHEGVPDGVACTSDPNSLHHSRVPELATAQLTIEHLRERSKK